MDHPATYAWADEILKDLDEDAAHILRHRMESKFGWSTCVWDRQDVDEALERPTTDDEWNRVQWSYVWTDGLTERARETGNEVLYGMLEHLGIEGNSDG